MTDAEILQQISELLPPGYIKKIPFSTERGLTFEYNGVLVKISAIYLNTYLNCYCFDLSWSSDQQVAGIPIRCGIDILKQFSTPLPNLYANNHAYPGYEITDISQLELIVMDETVLENA